MTSPEIICLGELLIDFVSSDSDVSLWQSSGFVRAAGGAPANVAVGARRLGAATGFIGKVGADPFGVFLQKTLEAEGVDTQLLITGQTARTTLSFVAKKTDGARDCIFYRHPGADMLLDACEIKEDYFEEAQIFHFGSISLSAPRCLEATVKAVEYARKHNLIVSYDPNLRMDLWDDPENAREKINRGFGLADVVKVSSEESAFILGTDNPEISAEAILRKGAKLVVVTMGGEGCYYTDGITSGYLPGYCVTSVEFTGAGDSFVSAMLYHLLQRKKKKGDNALTVDEELVSAFDFANGAGALATTKLGAIPSMPLFHEVLELLRGGNK